jgi:hypothetical protein
LFIETIVSIEGRMSGRRATPLLSEPRTTPAWVKREIFERTRGGTNQYFSIIGMLGTVPDSYLFQIPVTKYLLPPHTVLVIGPALDTVQNSR